MSREEIAYLGPEGTFAHLVTQKRYGKKRKLTPFPSIGEVFDYVIEKPSRIGIVPIENSSGGSIYETIDYLIKYSHLLSIQEELSIDVKLALLGRKGEKIKILFSHFAPYSHCEDWLRENLKDFEFKETKTTGEAAEKASIKKQSAALGTCEASKRYGLDIIKFPVYPDIPNITHFSTIARYKSEISKEATKSSFIVNLKNIPGSLYSFLEPFKREKVNLTRIVSRPIKGRPSAYTFFIDIQGTESKISVRRAIAESKKKCVDIRNVGSYPVRPTYQSK